MFVARMYKFTEKMFAENKPECNLLFKKCLKTISDGPSKDGIKYVHLDTANIDVVITVDGSQAVNPDKSSQIGIVAMVLEKNTRAANVIRYHSSKRKRVYLSPLTAERLAMVEGFDVRITLLKSLPAVTGRQPDLFLATVSKFGYDIVVTLHRQLSDFYRFTSSYFPRRTRKGTLFVFI